MKIYIRFCITSTIWLVFLSTFGSVSQVQNGLSLSVLVFWGFLVGDDDAIHLQRIMKIYIQFCITSTICLVSVKLVYLVLFLLLICHITSKMVKPSYRLHDDDIIHLQRIMKIYIWFCITSTKWLVSLSVGILGFPCW